MGAIPRIIVTMTTFLSAVRGQQCTDTVGSLSHDSTFVFTDQTYIIAGYTIPCDGTVVAWEFCYLVGFSSSETFYPGIWRITGTTPMSTDYALVQSSNVTFDPSGAFDDQYLCKIFNVFDKNQFIAPEGSVVGLYSGTEPVSLRTNNNNSITTYKFSGNQSSVTVNSETIDINYNIAIRVHLATVTPTSSIVSTSDAAIVTPTTSTAFAISTTSTIVVDSTVPASDDSSSNSDSITIIVGAVGGVILLLMITVVLCIVIVCVRRCHRKEDNKLTYNTTKLNTDVTIDDNPSYDVTKANTVDDSYSTINPGGSDVPITINPSYDVPTKPYSKTSEDDYNYVQPDELIQHSDLDGYLKIYPNADQFYNATKNAEPAEYGVINQPTN